MLHEYMLITMLMGLFLQVWDIDCSSSQRVLNSHHSL